MVVNVVTLLFDTFTFVLRDNTFAEILSRFVLTVVTLLFVTLKSLFIFKFTELKEFKLLLKFVTFVLVVFKLFKKFVTLLFVAINWLFSVILLALTFFISVVNVDILFKKLFPKTTAVIVC